MAISMFFVPSVKDSLVDHDINLSPMVRADHELLRVSFPISLLSRDTVDDPVTCCFRHTKMSSPTWPRWVLDDPVHIYLSVPVVADQDFVFDPLK